MTTLVVNKAIIQRREISTPFSGIFKVQVLNSDTGKWEEPLRGKKYKARRYVKSIEGNLKEIKRSFESISEAKAFRNGTSIEKEMLKNHPKNEAMTFGELVEVWKSDWLPNKDLTTQLRYKCYLRHYEFLWNMKVDEIEPTEIDKWIAYLKRPEYLRQCHSTRASFDHEFTVLRIILNFYSSRFNRNYRLPFIRDHNEMLRVKTKPAIKKDLNVDQLQAFFLALREECLGKEWEVIYYLALMQYGIYGRIQEAAALHFEDFDFSANKIEINKKVQWMRTKGYQDRVVTGLKSDAGKTLSPIPELATRVFKEWILRSGVRSGPLFQIDGKIISYRQIEYRYSNALNKARLAFSATHIIRHAALTEAYEACKDLLLVQRFAGQRDMRSTTHYAKVRDEQAAATQRKIDEKLFSIGT